jgi:hypothetical protein
MNARAVPNTLPCNQRTVGMILRGRLDPEAAIQRARMLVEDISWLGAPVRLCWTGPTSREVWPYYVFKNHTAPPEVFRLSSGVICKAVGYGLDWGDLVTFSKVVKLARRLWGRYWTRAFRERMKHFNNHISTIEEIWWLGLWESPTRIERECAYCAPYWRSVDWQFQTQGVIINLEVKYRAYDWLRYVDPAGYAKQLHRYFDGLAEKFPGRCAGQVNLVAMTLLGSLGDELRNRTEVFLQSHPAIDGFLFWSIARRDSLDCECILQPGSGFVRSLLRPADEEDRWRNPFLICTRHRPQTNGFAAWPDFDPLAKVAAVSL